MPSTSERQRRFMGADLARARAGKKTRTGMSESQLADFTRSVTHYDGGGSALAGAAVYYQPLPIQAGKPPVTQRNRNDRLRSVSRVAAEALRTHPVYDAWTGQTAPLSSYGQASGPLAQAGVMPFAEGGTISLFPSLEQYRPAAFSLLPQPQQAPEEEAAPAAAPFPAMQAPPAAQYLPPPPPPEPPAPVYGPPNPELHGPPNPDTGTIGGMQPAPSGGGILDTLKNALLQAATLSGNQQRQNPNPVIGASPRFGNTPPVPSSLVRLVDQGLPAPARLGLEAAADAPLQAGSAGIGGALRAAALFGGATAGGALADEALGTPNLPVVGRPLTAVAPLVAPWAWGKAANAVLGIQRMPPGTIEPPRQPHPVWGETQRYYHVAGKGWKPGEPVYTWDDLQAQGQGRRWQWGRRSMSNPDAIPGDTNGVSLHDNLADAVDFQKQYGGRILAIDVPRDLTDLMELLPNGSYSVPRLTRNSEGYNFLTASVPPSWIAGEVRPRRAVAATNRLRPPVAAAVEGGAPRMTPEELAAGAVAGRLRPPPLGAVAGGRPYEEVYSDLQGEFRRAWDTWARGTGLEIRPAHPTSNTYTYKPGDPLTIAFWEGGKKFRSFTGSIEQMADYLKRANEAGVPGAFPRGRSIPVTPKATASDTTPPPAKPTSGQPPVLGAVDDAALRAQQAAPPPPPAAVPPPAAPPPPGGPDPLAKLTAAIKSAGKATPEQRALFAQERAQRTAIGASVLERGAGPEAFAASKASMSGEFARPKFAVPNFGADDVTQLTEGIRLHPDLTFYDKLGAQEALNSLIAGRIPEPAKLQALQRAFPQGGDSLIRAVLGKRSLGQKALSELIGIAGIPQTLATSFDLSAPFRQGLVLGWSKPHQWLDAWFPMVKAAATQEGADAVEASIRRNNWFSRNDGLGFSDQGGHLFSMAKTAAGDVRAGGYAGLNESYVSRFVQAIPGIKQSERGFSTFLNKLGMDVYADTASKMYAAGVRDPEQYSALAKVINHARGYGDFSPGQIAPGVNAFFSGRNLVSRFQVVLDPLVQPGALQNAGARQLAAKNLIGLVGGNLSVLGMLGAVGAATGAWSVTMDPRSTDFGKIRIGNTRIDPWGGFNPLARLIARVASGEAVSSAGNAYPIDAKQEVLRFFRNKAAPIPSLLIDMLSGQNAVGEAAELTPERAAEMFTPFIAQDVVEALKQSGPAAAAVAGPASFFGLGTLSYETTSQKLEKALETVPEELRTDSSGKVITNWSQLTEAQQNRIRRDFPQFNQIQQAAQEGKAPSPAEEKTQEYAQRRADAFTAFQQTGDGAAYREALSNLGTEARGAYSVLFPDDNRKEPSADRQLVSDYFKQLDQAGSDFELRDKLDAQYRQSLTTAQQKVLDDALLTSSDPNYERLKITRDFLDKNYWQKRDEAYLKLVKNVQPGSPASRYKTYDDLAKAAADRTKSPQEVMQAAAMKQRVDQLLGQATTTLRIQDPKVDALLYVYGYKDGVVSPTAQAMVAAWAKENGVNLAPAPLRR